MENNQIKQFPPNPLLVATMRYLFIVIVGATIGSFAAAQIFMISLKFGKELPLGVLFSICIVVGIIFSSLWAKNKKLLKNGLEYPVEHTLPQVKELDIVEENGKYLVGNKEFSSYPEAQEYIQFTNSYLSQWRKEAVENGYLFTKLSNK